MHGSDDSPASADFTALSPEQDLRDRAEVRLRTPEDQELETLSPEEIRRTLHELRVHQAEIEIQNEELRRAQEELDATSARYFNLYDLAPVGYCTLGENGLILEANLTAATMLGAVRGALIGRPVYQSILKEDQDIFYRHRKQLLETTIPQAFDLRLVKMDETVFWARLHATVSHDSAGAPVFLIVMSDITEQKQAVEALRASELRESGNRFRRLFRRHSAVMLILDAETGSIIDANKAAVRFYGWPLEELKQMRIQQISTLPPEVVRIDLSNAALLKGAGFEIRHRRADGSIRDVEVFSNKIESAGKELLFSIIHDITERKQAEEDREATVEFLRMTSESQGPGELIQAATDYLRKHSGCETVRIRLKEKDLYPYYETRAIPGEFIPAGKRLCACDETASPICGNVSPPGSDCLCDNVIYGRVDSSEPFFTANGSFWSNCITDLPASIFSAALHVCPRTCWNSEGCQSVVLIPLRIGMERLGLLQFNGRQKGCFSPGAVALLERLADYLAAALAKVRADEVLRRAKEEWERTFDSVPDLITILDNQHRVLRVNKATARRLGVKPEDCVGLHCYEVVHGTSGPPRFCPHTRTIADGCEHAEEVHEERLGGHFLVTTSPLFNETGERVGSVHIAHDITERKRTEEVIRRRVEDLRVSNEELTRLTRASVGRELRMIELKQEINELCEQTGRPPRYTIASGEGEC